MNANELFFWLRGIFETSGEITPAQISHIRAEVLRAKPVANQILPVEMYTNGNNPGGKNLDCGCGK